MDVLVWGTGKFGTYISQQIKQRKNVSVKKFIDSNCDKWGKKIDGIGIISPDKIEQYYVAGDVILIAFMDGISIFDEFIFKGVYKVGLIRNKVLEAKMKLDEDIFNDPNILWNDAEYLCKPIIHSLETNIEDGCNLNCRGCSHFSNLFQKGDKVSFEIFCKDLKKIAENTYVYRFNLLGGEVLLNDRIVEYIEYTAKLMPYTDIVLVSNGLLIPKQSKEFFESCRKNNITIAISGYKPTMAMKDDITRVLDENGVVYVFRRVVEDFGKNIDLSGKNDRQTAVKRCRENGCHFMRQGKIYKCPFEALGNKFFLHFNIDARIEGGIDIYQDELDWQQVVNILNNEPVDACKYCGVEERIEWRVANNPVIEDWII